MKALSNLLVLAIVCCGWSKATAGERDSSEIAKVVWDLSNSRSTSALNGGNWTPSKPDLPDYFYIYHVKDAESISLVLESGEKYEVDGVTDIYAHRRGDVISEIIVNTREMNTDDAIAELKRMHERWRGEGIGDISSWRADISRGSLRRHNSLIRSLRSDAPLEVMVSLLNGFESEDSHFIQVMFSWPRLPADEQEKQNLTIVNPNDNTRTERSSKIEWNLSNGRSPEALRGGSWNPILQKLGNYIFVYEVDNLSHFRLVLENGDQFDFEDVTQVSAPRRDKVVTQVAVQTQSMSLPQAIDEVSRMHKRWKGEGLGEISAWQQGVARGSERAHDSLIRTAQTDGEPEIMASILKDRKSDANAWFIKVTFDWPKLGCVKPNNLGLIDQ